MDEPLYFEVEQTITKVLEKRCSVKTLVYSSPYKNHRQLFALVTEVLRYRQILLDVLEGCPELLEENIVQNSTNMALILLYEYLVGKGFYTRGDIRKRVVAHKTSIRSSRDRVLAKHPGTRHLRQVLELTNPQPFESPRYVRVNLIQTSIDKAIQDLVDEGWTYSGQLTLENFIERASCLAEGEFCLDPLLPDVFVLSTRCWDLHNHPMVVSGALVLQSRASCVPAHVLNPSPGSVILDCCAAPGNKTCHLSSLINNDGRIIAIDRDEKRLQTLMATVQRSGSTCVEVIHQDFLSIDPNSEDAKDVQLILLDPSCSGSGMTNQQLVDSASQSKLDMTRIENLKKLQIKLLKHALNFPNVSRLVYSTCSINPEENEEVVQEVMSSVNKYFRFEPVLPKWPSRGMSSFRCAQNFLRLSQDNDLTTGFFVACFERIRSKNQPVDKCDESKGKDKSIEDSEIGNTSVTNSIEANRNSDDEKYILSKKKKKHNEDNGDFSCINSANNLHSEKQDKTKHKDGIANKYSSNVKTKDIDRQISSEEIQKSKRKKKHKESKEESIESEKSANKRKRSKSEELNKEDMNADCDQVEDKILKKRKKSKKRKEKDLNDDFNQEKDENETKKIKKSKDKNRDIDYEKNINEDLHIKEKQSKDGIGDCDQEEMKSVSKKRKKSEDKNMDGLKSDDSQETEHVKRKGKKLKKDTDESLSSNVETEEERCPLCNCRKK